MGYQETLFKIDDEKTFKSNLKYINNFLDTECWDLAYSLVQFKEKIANINPGVYIYTSGDRSYGRRFLGFCNRACGGTSYCKNIEEALDIYNNYDDRNSYYLRDMFKNKSTKLGKVIYTKESQHDIDYAKSKEVQL